jgi:hypothetical protein
MGGTYAKDNVVMLTVAEHAEAHRLLFEQHGRWQDNVAYRSLSGLVGKEEMMFEIASNIGKIYGNKNKESGQWAECQKLGGKEQGRRNAESGHLERIKTHEGNVRGGQVAGKIAKESGQLLEASLKGYATSSRRVKSLDDGKVTTWCQRGRHEKKTGHKHNWILHEE